MSAVIELFGEATASGRNVDWEEAVSSQQCPFLDRKCLKVRKSTPELSVGRCSVLYGKEERAIIICPYRLLERRQIFSDCLHLLSVHEPGNELHVVPEVSVPGGSVDYFLTSVRDGSVKDFAGIELQTLDTTGTVWPARQRFLESVGFEGVSQGAASYKTFGMNWKMTAKTILIQLHHKIHTFEAINKHLALVIQDVLLDYLKAGFQFDHLNRARQGDPMHVHSYTFSQQQDARYRLALSERLSTTSEGIATCLGLQAEPSVELAKIIEQLESKLSDDTRLEIGT